ncbi:MAG: cobalamin-dependent protein, partial [Patescibacteria group bacterium]
MAEEILFVLHDDRSQTEPLNLMLLSALAKQGGRPFRTGLIVLERDDIVEVVKQRKPAIVAFSAVMGLHTLLLDAHKRLRREVGRSVKTVIGGPFATFRPQLINEEDFDAVGIGECDDAWPELLDAWLNGKPDDGIPNILTKENASRVLKKSLMAGWQVDHSHLRDRVSAMDDLPFMDRELIYPNTAFKHRYKRAMMAGRGCPFRCTYCFEHEWNAMYKGKGKVLARHSVTRLCAELRQLKEQYDTRFIMFKDDVFPVFNPDIEWLEEFAEVYPREVGLPYHCSLRAELVNEPDSRKLTLLKKSGIGSMTMSIESGNDFSRKYIIIRQMEDEDMRSSFAKARELRINTFSNTILGLPNPVLPDLHAPSEVYQAQLDVVLKAVNSNELGKKIRAALTARIEQAKTSAGTDREARLAVDKVLREVGLLEKRIDYEKESIRYTVGLRTSFAEYPVFFPYEGTALGDFAAQIGAFDGDYESLPASYQSSSPLDCFDEKEKLQQQNLALL